MAQPETEIAQLIGRLEAMVARDSGESSESGVSMLFGEGPTTNNATGFIPLN